MGYARYVGRVGALAVALGVGVAGATTPGFAWADETGEGTSSVDGGPANPDPTTAPKGETEGNTDSSEAGEPGGGTTTTTTTTTTGGGQSTTVIGGGDSPVVTISGSTVDTSGTTTAEKTPESTAPTSTPESTPTPSAVPTPTPSALPTPTPEATESAPAPSSPTSAAPSPAAGRGALEPSPEPDPELTDTTTLTLDNPGTPHLGQQMRGLAAPAPTQNLMAADVPGGVAALDVPAAPAPVNPFEAFLGIFFTAIVNTVSSFLAPIIGPGAPFANPVLWGLVEAVRRQTNQGYANSTPALDLQTTGQQDLDDRQIHGTLGASDPDGDALTYSVPATGVGAPANGGVTIDAAGGTWTYTPDTGYSGTDTFTITASDADAGYHIHGQDQTHTTADSITVTVAPPALTNRPPVANSDSVTVAEGGTTIISVLGNDTDPDGNATINPATVTVVSGAAHGSATANANGTITYVSNGDEVASDSFTYTVKDASGATSNTATVAVTITAVNDGAPVANADSVTVNEGGTTIISVLGNDTDPDGNATINPATVTVVSGAAHGTATANANGTITYVSNGDEVTSDSFTYTVKDASGATSNTATVAVTITAVNDGAPVANADSVTVAEGGTTIISVLGNDTDPDGNATINPATVTVVTGAAHGTATANANGTITYVSNGDEVTSDSFTYTVKDASGATSNTATVAVTVTAVNDGAPVANADSVTVAEGGTTTVSVLGNDTDPDGNATINPATVTVVTGAAHGTATANANGTITYVSNGDEVTSDSFTYTVKDASGATSNTATVSVTITAVSPVNQAPTAANDVATVAEGGTQNISVLGNDTDPDGNTTINPASVTVVTGPAHGTATANANGTITYVSNGDEVTSDSFTYTVKDASGATSNTATVSVTITAVNDGAPVANGDVATVAEGGTQNISVLGNDTDPDGNTTINPASVTVVTGPAHGTATANANGTITYVSNGAEGITSDSFTYTVKDASGATSNTATVSVTITVSQTANPAPIEGTPLGNAVVGSTGLVYQAVVRGTTQSDVTTIVRVYQPNGALIGDSAPITGVPQSAPVIRADGSIAVTTFDRGARTAVVTIVNGAQNHVTTSSTPFQADDGGPVGEGGKYLFTIYRDAQGAVHGGIVPLSIGNLTAHDISSVPVFGPDGSAAALLVTGSTPQTLSAAVVIVNANGTAHTVAAPELLNSGLAGNLSIGPDGTVYLPTVVAGQNGGTVTEVLEFGPGGGYTKRQVPGVSPASDVTAAPNGTAYLITTARDDNFDNNYRIAVLGGGGVITSSVFSKAFFQPTIIGTSDNGTLYVLDSDSDNDTSRIIIARPNGSFTAVGLGDFSFDVDHVIGADNNLYVNYRENDNFLSAVITSTGQKRVLPFDIDIDPFTSKATNLAFAADGTAFATVPTQDGVTVRVSTDGFATFRESAPIAGTVTGLTVGPDGTAVVLTRGPGVVATAIDPSGHILATVTSAGEATGAIAFDGNNGTAYVAVVQTNPSTGSASTSVWGITLAGATKVTTVTGTPAGGQNGAGATMSFSQQGAVFVTTSSRDENGAPTTNVSVAPGVSLPPSPYQVSRNTTDYATGVSSVKISVKPDSGLVGAITFTGSTQSPIGDVVVNPDGTVTFTPNAAGRQLAGQSGHVQYAGFVVTATDSQGLQTLIPVSAPLLPTTFPPDPVPLPLKYASHSYPPDSGLVAFLDLPGAIGDNFTAGGRAYSVGTLMEVSDPRWTRDGEGRWISYEQEWTRTSSVDPSYWTFDPLAGQPVNPDVYVVSLLHPSGYSGDGYVIGYRKMNLNDTVTITNEMPTGYTTTPYIDYDVAVFAPGTFPKQLFKTRIDPNHPDAEVGGDIFNNQIADDTWTPWQEQVDEFEKQRNYDEEMRIRAQYIGQGANMTLTYLQYVQGARGEVGKLVTAASSGKRIVQGVKVINGVAQLVLEEEDIATANGDSTTPVFVINGVETTSPPQNGNGGGA